MRETGNRLAIEGQEGTSEAGDCVVYVSFRGSVKDLNRRDVLGRGVDCQVEKSINTSKTGNHSEEDQKSGGNVYTGLLSAV